MTGILSNLRNTIILSALVALAFLVGYAMHYAKANGGVIDAIYWQAVLRFFHVLSGIMWIGLLYYFNFVQIPQMAKIPAEHKPAVSKFIAPAALFWFRWSALSTWVFGVLLAWNRGYLLGAITLGASDGFHVPQHTFIGVGMWVATIMFLNVWGIIWPNQKRALGIIEVDADKKARAARIAMLASRTNTLLSIPMLTTMAMNQTIFG
jgi:uncharacterized membrane protein